MPEKRHSHAHRCDRFREPAEHRAAPEMRLRVCRDRPRGRLEVRSLAHYRVLPEDPVRRSLLRQCAASARAHTESVGRCRSGTGDDCSYPLIICQTGRLHERTAERGAFRAVRRRLDPGVHVDRIGIHAFDGTCYVDRRESAREDDGDRGLLYEPCGTDPVPSESGPSDLSGFRIDRVDQECINERHEISIFEERVLMIGMDRPDEFRARREFVADCGDFLRGGFPVKLDIEDRRGFCEVKDFLGFG